MTTIREPSFSASYFPILYIFANRLSLILRNSRTSSSVSILKCIRLSGKFSRFSGMPLILMPSFCAVTWYWLIVDGPAVLFLTIANQSTCKNQSGERLESRKPTGISFTSTKMNIKFATGEYSVFVQTATNITNLLFTEDTKWVLTTHPA